MNRIEFVLATAVILFVAFALGWFAHWLVHRFTRIADADLAEVDRLAQALHEAEDLRDQAILLLEQREEELLDQLAQTEAELQAVTEGLGAARREADDMRARLDRLMPR
jgi:septal ring factor EnvC (AmiA/AmiB activator)